MVRYTRELFYDRFRQNVQAIKNMRSPKHIPDLKENLISACEFWIDSTFCENTTYCFMSPVGHRTNGSKYYREQSVYFSQYLGKAIRDIFLIMVQIWCEEMYDK